LSDLLQRVAEDVQEHMDAILANFKPGVKITVLVRAPGLPDRDFCMTNDDMDEVIAMATRRKDQG
jgi:predicted regulator of Ras-like GTPase activity (Roadblock/LC7/MglB family)